MSQKRIVIIRGKHFSKWLGWNLTDSEVGNLNGDILFFVQIQTLLGQKCWQLEN